ncbi:MAG: DNA gyrase subunit A [Candidatus Mcinerneyibacterium aminivorans]|uniref:DNA gyrase subunit A n=1 Tax=Candidatus Mcinerneyibacterium aminivorans TaxID=2703815 RepID=A0A5D0MG29_9BACT|nr:MAG: DNA gyrase subunit A [Candidatus Mcinerneyibacterium aminivorans]
MSEEKKNIRNVKIEKQMKQAYIDYAMSTIMGRALPDVRDGLKPVQRRILYGMKQLGLRYNKPHRKSAKVVGEVMGNYHPHGDQAIYDALVRMAQDFTYNVPLLDGQGNFGSIDGDPPAAQRYTEVRMDKISEYILQDIGKNTVDFRDNYDESQTEPIVLPSMVPNLLLNGSSGIAVGMSTEIPSHNLNELISGLKFLIDNPDCKLKGLMKHIKGPDFPTAGIIIGKKGIRNAFRTGKGKVKLRGKIKKEVQKNGKISLVISELPYKQNKAKLIEKIAKLARDGKLDGIKDLRDETNKEGIRVVLDIKRTKQDHVDIIINKLYKKTRLEQTYSMRYLALVNGIPKTMGLKEILNHFIDHRKEVVIRRTRYLLRKAEARAHIIEGLRIALANIDEVVAIIKKSNDVDDAKERLKSNFELSSKQAKAILDMRLQRLTSLEVQKLEEEYKDLIQKINYYKEILNNESLLIEIIKEELDEVNDKFNVPRRTLIIDKVEEFDRLDLIQEEDVVITITHRGFIKRVPESTYRTQRRGGKGLIGLSTIDNDFVQSLFLCSTHDKLLLFTNKGMVHQLNTLDIPEMSRTARGLSLRNLIMLEKDERIIDYITVDSFQDDFSVLYATKEGYVKKTELEEFENITKRGLIAIKLRDGDELKSVMKIKDKGTFMMFSKKGYGIRIREDEIKAQTRTAMGIIGMKLRKNDEVIEIEDVNEDDTLIFMSENGYSKKTEVEEFSPQGRAGKGVIAMNINEKTGQMVTAMKVKPDNHIFAITEKGQMVRVNTNEIRVQGRNTVGVKFINLNKGDTLKDISKYQDEKEKVEEKEENTEENKKDDGEDEE